MDGPKNSDCGLTCDCWMCTVCWQDRRNEDEMTGPCGTDVSAWLKTHYKPKYDESESAQAQREGRDVGPVGAFRSDLVHWLMANRTKSPHAIVGAVRGAEEFLGGMAEQLLYQLVPEVQLQVYMVAGLDESRYGRMPYEVYRQLLAEYNTIVQYSIATRHAMIIKHGAIPINGPAKRV